MLAFLERMASKTSSRRKRRSCCCHGVCIGFLRPEAQSQEIEIEHEIMKQFDKKGIAERDFIAENSLAKQTVESRCTMTAGLER